jgi:preprotein translocase subunit SecG
MRRAGWFVALAFLVTGIMVSATYNNKENRNIMNNNDELATFAGYCRIVIQPKLEKFKKVFEEKLK